jgi:two-component system chemotaxis response regulator CheB
MVAIAASAGGLRALSTVLGGLAPEFPEPILVVQHLDPHHASTLPQILGRACRLSVFEAREGAIVRPGHVYVAPPDHHLLVERGGILSLTKGELVHFVRPSADLLFESVAAAYRDRAIAVVLTGSGSDGSMGVRAIKKMGGTVIAQDEQTSEFFAMPSAAIGTGDVDFVLPLEEIPQALVSLVVG